MTIVQDYFRAVYADVTSRLEILGGLIGESHAGEHGRYIESVLADLLREWLPERYRFSTGFVIDSEGHRSSQCDIVVTDALTAGRYFSQTGPLLYPVEEVLMVIEVKRRLTRGRVREGCSQIASVKALTSKGMPATAWVSDEDTGGAALMQHPSAVPLGVLFAYEAQTARLTTLDGWFESAYEERDHAANPDLAISLREGFVRRYRDLVHGEQVLERMHFPLILRDSEGNLLQDERTGEWLLISPEAPTPGEDVYVARINGQAYEAKYKTCVAPDHGAVLADAPRLLLVTLAAVRRLLELREMHPKTAPLSEYLSRFFGEGLLLPEAGPSGA